MEFVTLYPGSARLAGHQLVSGEGGSAAAPLAASVPPGDARHWEARDYAWNPETITAWPVGGPQPTLPGLPVEAGAQEGLESVSLCQVPGCTVTPEEMRAYNMRCRCAPPATPSCPAPSPASSAPAPATRLLRATLCDCGRLTVALDAACARSTCAQRHVPRPHFCVM